ncbi:hypothetical protein CAC42_1808 [Sphaceloma murrayae]|uniref:Uncharacterized protein n=1 Tax=Sphaceloma murrayae TaxID=2082308 RepID=A0A2K1QVJ0_9PEZI|nr:hypothetical protein CAC42_1808 [Sphaceloma murrayae]
MATNREQRVDDALQQLVSRLVPSDPDDEDDERRWEEAMGLARRVVEAAPSQSTSEDASHAADLIRSKLVRDTGRPEKATRFSALYSRLLTQPVLGQKWAILYFLYKMAEVNVEGVRSGLEMAETPDRIDRGGVGGGNHAGGTGDGQEAEERLREARRERRERVRVGAERKDEGERIASREEGRESSGTPIEQFARRPFSKTTRGDQPASPRAGSRREALASRPISRRAAESQEVVHKVEPPATPKEADLLRDLPFTLQGLQSVHLPFDGDKTLRLPRGLPVPLVSLLHALAEPSLLYRRLARFVDSDEGGLVGQSLRSAIGEELRAYLGLVATLEGQIRKALAQIDESMSPQSLGKAGVTLKRCVVWTRDATLGLRLMSMIVEEAAGRKGGYLITLIHKLSTSHGDPFVHTFATRLLHKVTKPFYIMLQHWIFSGALEDPFAEFFVSEKPDSDAQSATSIWTDKYVLNDALVPSIMTHELASQVYLIGKSLNFIRSACLDSTWVESYTASSSKELSFSDPTSLQASITAAYTQTTARVLELMSNKFHLFQHLSALKKYLLLGQGDFIAILLESLATNLDGPANSQYRHHLTSALDHSIRNSNAQYEAPDITRRLDARMLELSHGEIGWDVFTLEYRMDSPLDVVVGPWAQKQYLKIFNFLWRIKRVEFTLGQVWGRCMTGSRGVLRFVGEGERRGTAAGSEEEGLKDAWKRARGGLAAMVHFVGQLQYYILFEVIESGWEKLKGEMVKDVIDALYSHSVAEFTRRQDKRRTGRTSTWGLDEEDDMTVSRKPPTGLKSIDGRPLIPMPGDEDEEADGLGKIKKRLVDLEADFKARVNVLLGDLAYQQDTDMRFLGVVMNFNDVYRPVRRRRGGKERERRDEVKREGEVAA